MNKKTIAIILILIYHAIWAVLEGYYQTSNWIYLFPLVLSAVTGVWGFWSENKEVKELKESEKRSHEDTQKLVKQEAKTTKEENELTNRIHTDNLLNIQFNRFLESQKLDRALLLKELEGNKVETLYIVKQKEGGEEKPLKDRIKLLGFKNVTYGDWILPPKKLKNKTILHKKNGVKQWVEENLINDIDLDEFVNSVLIVNLSNIYDEEKGDNSRARKIIGGVLKPADFTSKDKLLSEIHKKENISFREIIQIPFLDTLVDSEHPQISEQIKKLNSEIIKEIKKRLSLDKLNTTDLMKLEKGDLEKILKNLGVKSFKITSDNILMNVQLINSYLNLDNK